MLYTCYPIDLIMDGSDKLKPYEELTYRGVLMQVERLEDHSVKIARLISANPADFMDANLMPGTIINFTAL